MKLIEKFKKKVLENLFKIILLVLLSFGITIFLYWPIYQKIPINNNNQNINVEISKIDLPLGENIKEILDRTINFPKNTHELCLRNKNKFYFVHSDSKTQGIPFNFYTEDLNKIDYGKENKLGAMSINLYYKNNFEKDENYREFGQPIQCKVLDNLKLKDYASSTIEYRYADLTQTQQLDIKDMGKLTISHRIDRGYFIDTSNSSAFIVPRWNFFLLTLGAVFGLCFWLLNLFFKKSK